jgi:hypothetical protein
MPIYTSHIYAAPKESLITRIRENPILSAGLYHIRDLPPDFVKDFARGGLPQNGLIVVREVCDSTRNTNQHDEAYNHIERGNPVLPWSNLIGPQNLRVIRRRGIPAIAFGRIYKSDEHNPVPPIEFLRFLKQLSIVEGTSIAYYHHYTAFEDRLADAEYAWVFSKKEDLLYIRHEGERYRTVVYDANNNKQTIHSKITKDQPILHEVMHKFGAILSPASYRPYFYEFAWNDHKV